MRRFFVLIFLILPTGLLSAPIVKKITILGNERISKDAIREVIKTKPGDILNRDRIREDIKNIYKMGYFRDVQVDVVDRDGGKEVIFIVVEKPVVGSVGFRGAKKVSIKTLREKIKTKEGEIFSEKKVKEDIDALTKFYLSSGYYGTTVRAETKEMPGNRVRVVFIIKEKKKLFVKKIRIVGNKRIKTKELKKVLNTREKSIFSFFTGSGVLDEEAIRGDINNLKAYYMDHGFIDAKVMGPEITLTKDKKGLVVTYRIKEGDQYRCRKVNVFGDLILPKWFLMSKLHQRSGSIFRGSFIRKDLEFLTNLYADRGYAFVDVNPHIIPDRKKKTVDVSYEITKNNLARIGRISISGNLKTKDRVIRREVRFAEGDFYSASKLKRTKQRLQNLGFFDQVEIKTKRRDKDTIDLEIHVNEARTGSVILGLGFSSVENFVISGSIEEKNFLGTGCSLYWGGQIGGVSQHYTFDFLNPRFRDTDTSLGFSIYDELYEYDSFDSKEKGFSFSLGKEVSEYTSVMGSYRFKSTEVYDVSETASSYVKESEGKYVTSSIYLRFAKDTRDYVKWARHGYLFINSLELAGIGGNTRYIKGFTDFTKCYPGPKTTRFSLRWRFGFIKGIFGKSVPIYEKFYAGGPSTIRGLEYGEAGPLDSNLDPIGGRYEFINNVEWWIPIVKEIGLNGFLFTDIGRSSNSITEALSDLRLTTGFGFNWLSPMGPINIIFAFNPFKRHDEKSFRTDFSFGRMR